MPAGDFIRVGGPKPLKSKPFPLQLLLVWREPWQQQPHRMQKGTNHQCLLAVFRMKPFNNCRRRMLLLNRSARPGAILHQHQALLEQLSVVPHLK